MTTFTIVKSGPTLVAPGAIYTYTISITSSGSATNAQVTDSLSTGSSNILNVTQSPGPVVFTLHNHTGIIATNGNFTGSQTANLTLTVQAPSNTVGIIPAITNNATVAANDTGAFDSNTIVTSIINITKNASPTIVTPGSNFTYSITVTNVTSIPVTVLVKDSLPTGVSLASGQMPSVTSTTPAPNFTFPLTLAPGASITITIPVTLSASFIGPGSISNTAFIVDPSTGMIVNSATATITTTVASADLAVTKSGPSFVCQGNIATYAIILVNNGPSDAINVVVSDILPIGANIAGQGFRQVYISSQLSRPVVLTGNSFTINANILSFPAFVTIVFLLDVCFSSKQCSRTFINTVTVTSGTPDPDLTNNTSSVTTTEMKKKSKKNSKKHGSSKTKSSLVIKR
jgi:uncharacterized repeat protein (TIGR01451 family)